MQTGDNALMQNLRRRAYADYLAILFAPAPKRAGLAAISDFCWEISRIGMQVKEPLLAEMRLHYWQESLKAAWENFSSAGQAEMKDSAPGALAAAAPAQAKTGNSGHFAALALADEEVNGAVNFSRGQSPLVKALANAGKTYNLPLKPLVDLCAAAVANTERKQPPSRAEFEQYCFSVYSGRAELACRISAGKIMAEAEFAADCQVVCRHGGIAQGIAALAAGLPQQLQRQMLFVPAEILAGIGLVPQRLMALAAEDRGRPTTPEIQRLAAALAAYFAEHYKDFKQAQRRLPAILRPAFLPLAVAPLFMWQVEKTPNLLWRPNAVAGRAAGPSLMRQQGRIIAAALFNRF